MMELSSVLISDAAPGSHEWVPCVGHEFATSEAFELALNKMAANNFFVVRFKRGSARESSGHLARVDACCNRSYRGRL